MGRESPIGDFHSLIPELVLVKLSKTRRGIPLEHEVLLCVARANVDCQRAEHLKTLLRNDLDWDYVFEMGHRHGLLPLLYWHLNSNWSDMVPHVVLDRLREHFLNNVRKNLFWQLS